LIFRAISVQLACRAERRRVAVVLVLLGLDVGIGRVRDGVIGTARLVLVDQRGALGVVPIRAIRSLMPVPPAAANVLPVWRRSWTCRPGAPIEPTAYGQADILLKLLRRL